jgi:hypothetical protein
MGERRNRLVPKHESRRRFKDKTTNITETNSKILTTFLFLLITLLLLVPTFFLVYVSAGFLHDIRKKQFIST